MDLLNIVWTSLGSIVALFFLTKLMGYREMSEMSMYDYINGITIGSIAAEMATDLEKFQEPFTAMIVYSLVIFLISKVTDKSIKARRFIEGTPLLLLNNGQIYFKNLKKARLDVNEFLSQCRNSGYFDISQVQTIILESNGKLSILPKAELRPATPQDMGIKVESECMVANLVIDGHILPKNLKHVGKNEKWLMNQLSSQGIKDISEVLLATCDIHNKVTVFKKLSENPTQDILD